MCCEPLCTLATFYSSPQFIRASQTICRAASSCRRASRVQSIPFACADVLPRPTSNPHINSEFQQRPFHCRDTKGTAKGPQGPPKIPTPPGPGPQDHSAVHPPCLPELGSSGVDQPDHARKNNTSPQLARSGTITRLGTCRRERRSYLAGRFFSSPRVHALAAHSTIVDPFS